MGPGVRKLASFLGAFLFVSAAHAEDRLIVPRFDSAEAMFVEAPLFDRGAGRELARVRIEPLNGDHGTVQPLGPAIELQLPAYAPAALGRISIEGVEACRMRVRAEPGTVLWLAGSDDEELIRFEVAPGVEWGPTTRGGTIFVAAEAGRGSVTISELASVPAPKVETTCLTDVACTGPEQLEKVGAATRAIGYIRYMRDGKSYVCTGGLVNDAAGSGTPYFLTARHCIRTQAEASTVEIVWDLRSEACGSNRMLPVSRSYGAELLVASEATDVALLKLRSIPAGRAFLGVDTRPVAPGTSVYRISHAGGLSQTYTSGTIKTEAMTCSSAPRPRFIYSQQLSGATTTGSSGAPLLLEGGFVTGQMLGLCGADPGSSCASFNAAVDGSIRESWPLLRPYLDPTAGAGKRRAVR